MYVVLFDLLCQAEDGIRDLVRSRGLGDVYKRQVRLDELERAGVSDETVLDDLAHSRDEFGARQGVHCLLYTSDAADERSSVDLGGRRIIKIITTYR